MFAIEIKIATIAVNPNSVGVISLARTIDKTKVIA